MIGAKQCTMGVPLTHMWWYMFCTSGTLLSGSNIPENKRLSMSSVLDVLSFQHQHKDAHWFSIEASVLRSFNARGKSFDRWLGGVWLWLRSPPSVQCSMGSSVSNAVFFPLNPTSFSRIARLRRMSAAFVSGYSNHLHSVCLPAEVKVWSNLLRKRLPSSWILPSWSAFRSCVWCSGDGGRESYMMLLQCDACWWSCSSAERCSSVNS